MNIKKTPGKNAYCITQKIHEFISEFDASNFYTLGIL